MTSANLYRDKPLQYFTEVRHDLVAMIPGERIRVLEIGCGSGATGAHLLDTGKAAWVTGVEMVPDQAAQAAAVLSEVLVGDISALQFPWNANSFDCILAGDVLEHLVDPTATLRRLKPLLKTDGLIVASLPNVRHWPVIKELVIDGEWRYQDGGVLDDTHMRFFTRRSLQRMFLDSGYLVEIIAPYFWGPKTYRFDRVTFGAFKEFLAQRWRVRCRPQWTA